MCGRVTFLSPDAGLVSGSGGSQSSDPRSSGREGENCCLALMLTG